MKKRGRELTLLVIASVSFVLLAGCAAPVPSPTVTPTFLPPPSVTPAATRQPRPPADLTKTSAPPKIRAIQLDQTTDATYIPGDANEIYVFASDRARWVSIELVPRDGNGDLRLVVQVYNADNILIPKVSASIGQPSLRDVWDIPTPGTYTIRLFGTETIARAFDLRVFSVPIPETGGGAAACNKTRSGELAVHGQRDQWAFEAGAGDRVTIAMLAPGNDGIVELYDPDDKLIAHTGNASPATLETTLSITLPGDGVYTIVVRMYGDAQAGTYRLTVTCAP